MKPHISMLLTNFSRATRKLKDALVFARKKESELIIAGCLQYFEFCFELAWKSIKAILEDKGLHGMQSPKSCIQEAYHQQWINNEKRWIEILECRNITAHVYSAADAKNVYRKLRHFVKEFEMLQENLKSAAKK